MSFGAEYLRFPDLFPARDSGERWGDNELVLGFSGGPYVFRGLSDTQLSLLGRRFGDLQETLEEDEPATAVEVFQVSASDFRELEPIPGRPYDMDLDYQSGQVRIAAPRLMGRIRMAPIAAALWTSVEQPLKDLIGIFENFFRLVVAYRLNLQGGALLHSAAAVKKGRAYLFLGRSGAGKSTISQINLDAGLEVLSDDMNALVFDREQVLVEKLPFAGDLGQTGERRGGAPLAGIFRLEQAREHSLTPLPGPEALALLVSCSSFLNADSHRTDRLMENLSRVVRSCRVRRLGFRRDAEFWDLIEDSDGY